MTTNVPNNDTGRRVSAAGAMLAGAVAGALMLKTSIALPLSCAAVIALIAGRSYAQVARRKTFPPQDKRRRRNE